MRRTRWLLGWGSLLLALLIGCESACAAGTVAPAPPTDAPTDSPTPADSPRWDPDGHLLDPAPSARQQELTHDSAARGKPVTFWAAVPETGDPADRFPVLYLLHGAYDGHRAWPDHAADEIAALAREHGLIVVAPDGDPFGWYLDSPVDPTSQIERYLFDELFPHVEATLPAEPGRRAIAGLSMGGHGAISLALTRPGAFTSASSMSGILDLTAHPGSWELPDRLGPYADDPDRWQRHSVLHLLRARPGQPGLPLRITCGDADPAAIGDNRAVHALLAERGVDHEYVEQPGGGHTWEYWVGQLAAHVAFHAEYLAGDGVRSP